MITIDEVKKIAKLARIKLSHDEEYKHAETMSAVLDYMKILNEVETAHIEPTSQVTGLFNVVRDDIARPSVNAEQLVKNIPLVEDNKLKICGVFETSDDV